MGNIAIVSVGGLFLVIAVIGYIFPITSELNYSLPQVVGLCNSGMGQLGQAFSGDIVKACSDFNGVLYGIYGLGILGIILLIVGAVIPSKSKEKKEYQHEREVEDDAIDILEKRYAKGELSKGEFDKMKEDLE